VTHPMEFALGLAGVVAFYGALLLLLHLLRPRHTPETVLRELIDGLEDGSIVLPDEDGPDSKVG
jgi:hypothetical protein